MPRALSARLTGYVLCSLIAGCGGTATDGPTSPAPAATDDAAATDADSSAQENMTVDDPSADAAARGV